MLLSPSSLGENKLSAALQLVHPLLSQLAPEWGRLIRPMGQVEIVVLFMAQLPKVHYNSQETQKGYHACEIILVLSVDTFVKGGSYKTE